MRYCTKCGNILSDHATLCSFCRTPVSPYPDYKSRRADPPVYKAPATPNTHSYRSYDKPRATSPINAPSRPASYSNPPAPNTLSYRSCAASNSSGYRDSAGPSSKAKASNNTGSKIKQNNRLLKSLICLPIAAALIFGIILFFEINLADMGQYVNTVAQSIRDLGMFEDQAQLLGTIAVYGLAVMIVLSAFMFPARLSGAVLKTCSIGDKVVVTIAGYFLIALTVYLKITIIDQGVISYFFSSLFKLHGIDRLKGLLPIAILLILILVALAFIVWSSSVLISVVVNNISVNGPVLGIIAAAYELLSSVFVTALVLCAFSFGVAIILMPFIILAACSSGRTVAYDQYGNMYYIS